jgi:hypothetical protein
MANRSLPLVAFLSCSLATLVGCQGNPPNAISADEACKPAPSDVRTHDFGEVITGEELSHVFSFTNDSDEFLGLNPTAGIQKDCGCEDVQVRASELAPGAATDVLVKLNTTEKVGRFAYGGVVTWRTRSGREIATRFAVRGLARRAVTSSPSVVHFDPEDVRLRRSKEVRFTAQCPVQWELAKVVGSQPLVHIIDRQISGNLLICKIQSTVPEDAEQATGELSLKVPMINPSRTLSVVGTSVPVSARQEIEFAVNPKLVMARQDRQTGKAWVRLQVSGKKVSGKRMKGIRCEGFAVDWSMTEPTRSGMAVVTVALSGPVQWTGGSKAPLVLDVDGIDPITVPLVWLTNFTE